MATLSHIISKFVLVEKSYRSKEIKFGDGYKHTALDGLNYETEIWNLQFAPVDSTSAAVLESILLNSVKGTNNYITWTPPDSSSSKIFSASGITKESMENNNFWKMSCILTKENVLS
jgi:phage-related protein